MKRLLFSFLLFYNSFCCANENFNLGYTNLSQNNNEIAFHYFSKAAKEDHFEPAQYILGYMYESGKGVSKDKNEATYWYQKSANQGNLRALYYLNIMHLKEDGLISNENEAFSWYQKEADNNNVNAQFALGVIYQYGIGASKSLKEAHYWYQKAAETGNANAQFALGTMYKYGQGVTQSAPQAGYWYRKAAKQGLIVAQKTNPEAFDFSQFGLKKLPGECDDHVPHGDYEKLSDIKLNNINIKLIRNWNSKECRSGFRDHIHLNGIINPDSSFIIEKLLTEMPDCQSDEGVLPKKVYMNSQGGLIRDGFIIGNSFRIHNVQAIILSNQYCASSCSIAFIGAIKRELKKGGTLLFHAPYEKKGNNKIGCNNESANILLRTYFEDMLGKHAGKRLFDRTMSFCSENQGWEINTDAARIYNIINYN